MLKIYDNQVELGEINWLRGRAIVIIPPCDRVAVTCSYTLSTCQNYYVGFVEGRFGSLMNARFPLAICWPGGIMRYVSVTTFSDRSASFRVLRSDWIEDG